MFGRILVANRGEIACRILRTARAMGIGTVAVYSDADARSPHVRMADEAVHIGASPPAESYLRAERIIEACRATGAEAVHPGYGFLSERASFAEALEAEDIVFIGPPASAIAAMGDKIESKRIALAAGVRVVPGFVGAIEGVDHAARLADEIGYPVMLKASAGGGGKGMRLATHERELREHFEGVRREAAASFGDDRLLIERFIARPRHIEIQLLGDKHGHLIHLGERECSIQRRHQKVIEEAPSPFVSAAMRERLGAQAIALARAVGYYSAGTVELIVSGADPSGESAYFLEMNTRLQVEHPVTEAVTGVDLVEQMIRVAAGEPLALRQEDIAPRGWAIETRVYAEDPYRGFLPSTGRLTRYNPPLTGEAYVRVDDGVEEGGEVSRFYDPMIAKLITLADTREAAVALQVDALDRFEIEGPSHNLDFLSAVMQNERFRAGDLTTGFIAETYPDGFDGAPVGEARLRTIAAIAAGAACAQAARARRISGQLNAPPPVPCDWSVRLEGRDHAVTLGAVRTIVDGHAIALTCNWRPGQRTAEAMVGGPDGERERLGLKIGHDRLHWRIATHGRRYRARAVPARLAPLAALMIEQAPPDVSRLLICPMPGLLVALHVAQGDRVEPGQPLATVEAMKMENVLRASRAGTVAAIRVEAGASLAAETVILELE